MGQLLDCQTQADPLIFYQRITWCLMTHVVCGVLRVTLAWHRLLCLWNLWPRVGSWLVEARRRNIGFRQVVALKIFSMGDCFCRRTAWGVALWSSLSLPDGSQWPPAISLKSYVEAAIAQRHVRSGVPRLRTVACGATLLRCRIRRSQPSQTGQG